MILRLGLGLDLETRQVLCPLLLPEPEEAQVPFSSKTVAGKLLISDLRGENGRSYYQQPLSKYLP